MDCIIEIGAVEMFDGEISGVQFHSYVNARRKSHPAAEKIHGLTPAFLSKHRPIESVMKSFMRFVGESRMVAHNAPFDVRMLNVELKRMKLETLDDFRVFCSAKWWRKKYPGRGYSLDDVCKQLGVDTSRRTMHGALL